MVFSGIQGIGIVEVVRAFTAIDREMPEQEFQSPTTTQQHSSHTQCLALQNPRARLYGRVFKANSTI
jgi:hypothetical protein